MKYIRYLLAVLLATGAIAIAPIAQAEVSYRSLSAMILTGRDEGSFMHWYSSSYLYSEPEGSADPEWWALGSLAMLSVTGNDITVKLHPEIGNCAINCVLYFQTPEGITNATLDQASIDFGLAAGMRYDAIPNQSLANIWGHERTGLWIDLTAGFPPTRQITVTVNPVPEAETYAMLLVGLGLLGVVARRRMQS